MFGKPSSVVVYIISVLWFNLFRRAYCIDSIFSVPMYGDLCFNTVWTCSVEACYCASACFSSFYCIGLKMATFNSIHMSIWHTVSQIIKYTHTVCMAICNSFTPKIKEIQRVSYISDVDLVQGQHCDVVLALWRFCCSLYILLWDLLNNSIWMN